MRITFTTTQRITYIIATNAAGLNVTAFVGINVTAKGVRKALADVQARFPDLAGWKVEHRYEEHEALAATV